MFVKIWFFVLFDYVNENLFWTRYRTVESGSNLNKIFRIRNKLVKILPDLDYQHCPLLITCVVAGGFFFYLQQFVHTQKSADPVLVCRILLLNWPHLNCIVCVSIVSCPEILVWIWIVNLSTEHNDNICICFFNTAYYFDCYKCQNY